MGQTGVRVVGTASALIAVMALCGACGQSDRLAVADAREPKPEPAKAVRSMSEPVVGPIDVYVGDGIDIRHARKATEWVNQTSGVACLNMIDSPWTGGKVPPGVISIEVDDHRVGESRFGSSSWPEQGAGTVALPNRDIPQPDITIAHEILHITLNAGDGHHADDNGVFAIGRSLTWTLPEWHTEQLRSFCGARGVPSIHVDLVAFNAVDIYVGSGVDAETVRAATAMLDEPMNVIGDPWDEGAIPYGVIAVEREGESVVLMTHRGTLGTRIEPADIAGAIAYVIR